MRKTTTENREPDRAAKRAYRSPAIEESGRFERLVLACTHTEQNAADGITKCEVPEGVTNS